MSLHHCRVVLVQPTIAGNIGATARVMRNMGLTNLVLVSPQASLDDRQTRQLATHGEEILDRARVVDRLSDAVADCALVLGTSARRGGLLRRQSVVAPAEIMPRLVAELRAGQSAALVFGTEAHGLTDEEVTRCHFLITIPADDSYPVLNLAQAVAICLYELRKGWEVWEADDPGQPSCERRPVAAFADQDRMFAQLEQALRAIHFLYGPKAESLMHALRHLLGRAGLTPMEVDVLSGLARQIRWYADHNKQLQALSENQP
ncbi:MAG: RNA methyltransferase [Planctomycetes bacterium]|nr:RNA methyltransferase [Planctomycetota bacterium]